MDDFETKITMACCQSNITPRRNSLLSSQALPDTKPANTTKTNCVHSLQDFQLSCPAVNDIDETIAAAQSIEIPAQEHAYPPSRKAFDASNNENDSVKISQRIYMDAKESGQSVTSVTMPAYQIWTAENAREAESTRTAESARKQQASMYRAVCDAKPYPELIAELVVRRRKGFYERETDLLQGKKNVEKRSFNLISMQSQGRTTAPTSEWRKGSACARKESEALTRKESDAPTIKEEHFTYEESIRAMFPWKDNRGSIDESRDYGSLGTLCLVGEEREQDQAERKGSVQSTAGKELETKANDGSTVESGCGRELNPVRRHNHSKKTVAWWQVQLHCEQPMATILEEEWGAPGLESQALSRQVEGEV